MKTYRLKGNNGKEDILLTIEDLVPVPHKRAYSFQQLVSFVNNQQYETDWETPMNEEHTMLYEMHEEKASFFKDKHTELILVPGDYLHPTLLSEQDIMDLDTGQRIDLYKYPNNETMHTNFFNQIGQMNLNGDILLTFSKATDTNLIVSVMLQNEGCGDDAKNIIPPFTLNGTAEELDEGFFERITTPLQSASGLMDNMEVYMKKLDEARKNSAMEKEKTDKEKKEKDEKEKKYKEAMSKADSLEKEGKFREAWTALPKASDYPEHAEAIRKKKESYERQFAPTLFT